MITIREIDLLCTSGSIIGFKQTVPIYADKSFIANQFTLSKYISFSDNFVLANKYYLSTVDGLDNQDVRLNKRNFKFKKIKDLKEENWPNGR